jgi:sugar phosphate isomerase/epimerase
MQNRRDFLKRTSLVVAGGLLAPQFLSSSEIPAPYGKTMGFQLYSLRDLITKSGIQAGLEAVAKIGYKNLETAGYGDGKIYGLAPADFKKRCDDLGLKCTSAHLGRSYDKEKEAEVMAWWDQAIEAHRVVGAKYIVQASMPVNDKSKIEELKTYCDYFSAVGKKTAAAGIGFGYHNHTVEFKKIGDEVIYDYMLKNVSKQHVKFELDVYWCHEGGSDPAVYLKKYADQIRLIHIKDAKEIGASGTMDFKAIFDQMNANKVTDWFVEIEQYTNNDPVASAQQSFDFLNKAGYVK